MKRITRIGLSLLLATSLELSLSTCTMKGRIKDDIKEDNISSTMDELEVEKPIQKIKK